jgi:serine/threonine-protein kinase
VSRYRGDVNEPDPTSVRPPSQSGHPARIGHYKIVAQLGAGITANVYRAESDGIGRTVVLKVLRSNAGRESVFHRRFEREARVLSALRHPGLIDLLDYDGGVAGERPPFMVLEHVAGATVRELLERLPRLDPEEAAAIALEVARALAYAHQSGVVHRDVKPANVLIGRSAHRTDGAPDDRVVVKLLDFGVAHEGALPSDGDEAIGTPAYMSPEQLLGELADHRSDQFSLGIVLYQMLAGGRPFDGEDGRPAIQRIRRDPPRAFRSVGVTVPRALERIVLRCLAKRPSDRFERTEELVTELSAFVETRLGRTDDLGAILRRPLARAGFLDERRSIREENPRPDPRSRREAPLRVRAVPLAPTLFGIGAASLAMIASGAIIQWRLGGIRERPTSPVVADAKAATETGAVRVLARPWAEIVIDGRVIDVTPLARPIPLPPGRHLVVFRHPAATEKRLVDVVAGQTVTVEVVLPVAVSAPADEFLPPSTSAQPSASASARPPSSAVPSTLQP